MLITKIDLFKYYSPEFFDSIEQKNKSNLYVIETGQFYYQSPDNFNDPWDCLMTDANIPKNNFDFIHQIEALPEGQLPDNVNKLKELISNTPNIQNLDSSFDNAKPQNQIKDLMENFGKCAYNIQNNIGVCCMSSIHDHELLWAHYASNHKGFVVHLEIPLIELGYNISFLPMAVKYTDTPFSPTLYHLFTPPQEWALDFICTKSNSWTYENELRFLKADGSGLIQFPIPWIKSVITGLNMEPKIKGKIHSLCSNSKIEVFEAKRHPKKFEIIIPNFPISRENSILQIEEYNKHVK